MGFDGSYSGDATAIVAVQIGDMPHLDVVRLWEDVGGQVPIIDVEHALRIACKRWRRVQAIVADPFRWARSLQMLADERLPVEEFPQSPARMTPATQRFGEAVLNKALTHSGDPDLARHVGNVVVKNDSRGHRIVKEHRDSTRRIDLAVAAVMAYAAASTVETGRRSLCSTEIVARPGRPGVNASFPPFGAKESRPFLSTVTRPALRAYKIKILRAIPQSLLSLLSISITSAPSTSIASVLSLSRSTSMISSMRAVRTLRSWVNSPPENLSL